ncbi:MAG: multicopper oxidase family protein [Polyangiaceae bacterium]|nr:multicopper oxidase family protein [Polyangiaceae bacterium]
MPNREPPGWADDVALKAPVDLNADPHILEINLTATPSTFEVWSGSKPTPVYSFDGGVPGPLIELSAGDRLIVHFKNELPEPTTIHWHGLRINADMDGVPEHSQPEVPPGGTFDYDFIVPDAGLFWYHPHFNSSAQVGAGLYGPLLVRPVDGSEDAAPKDEVVLVLSDIGINDDGSLVDPKSGGELGALFGSEGNFLLVNGRWLPTLKVRSGITQRWRLVNAARNRYFQLALPGAKFTRIGNDAGLLEKPVEESKLLLTPGQRADVLVTPSAEQGTLQFLMWLPFDRGPTSTDHRPEQLVMRLHLTQDPPGQPTAATFAREIKPIDITQATQVNVGLTQMKDQDGNIVLGINGQTYANLPPFPAKIGETQVWSIGNQMDWSHPFHLHGFFFQVLDENGAPEQPLAWNDTIDVPFHSTRKIAVRFDERPGMWMFHCHILDHADAGMMGMIHLMP